MCLTLKFNNRFCVSYDILVYKMLNDTDHLDIRTPFKNVPVLFKDGVAELQINDEDLKPNMLKDVNKGIHSYSSLSECRERSFVFTYSAYYAIIPAGTPFYVGKREDVVSSKLIIFKTENDLRNYEDKNGMASPLSIKPLSLVRTKFMGYILEGEAVKEA